MIQECRCACSAGLPDLGILRRHLAQRSVRKRRQGPPSFLGSTDNPLACFPAQREPLRGIRLQDVRQETDGGVAGPLRRTAHGNGSISENATGSQRSGSQASVAASTPEKMLAYLIRPPSRLTRSHPSPWRSPCWIGVPSGMRCFVCRRTGTASTRQVPAHSWSNNPFQKPSQSSFHCAMTSLVNCTSLGRSSSVVPLRI